MPKRVVIVGAGPGGLAISLLLAKAGLDVTIIERQSQVGGRTQTFERDGFRWDCGPTFFLYPRVLEEIFTAIGRDLHEEVPMLRLDPQYRLTFGAGGQIDATSDVARMQEQLRPFSAHDAESFPRFLEDNRVKLARFRPCLENPYQSWRDLFRPHMLKALPHLRPWNSVEKDLTRYFEDPRVRLAFSFQSKYLGMSPFRCPSLFTILSFLEYEYGVFHPLGGCGSVTAGMARIAEELGVEIRLAEPVEEMLIREGRAIGVRTSREEVLAEAVVVNADFARFMTSAVPDSERRRWTDRAISKKKFSCSTFMLYLGIDGRYDDLPHHTIYMSEDYAGNLRDIESRHVLSDDPSFYIQNACVTDPSLAPEGASTLYVLVPVTHTHPNVDWSRERDRFRQLALRQLSRVGCGDVEQRIRVERVLTPADWDHGYNIHLGATFNLAHNLSQMLHLRPRNRFDDVDGVYLVGGGTHPGSGLPVIFESARISAGLLFDELGVDWHERLVAPGESRSSPAVGAARC